MVSSTAEVMQNYNYRSPYSYFGNFKYVKCSKTDLIINSGLGLASKVIGLKSEAWPEALKQGSADIAFGNCHGSFPVSFLYVLYNLERILSVKTLGNPLNLACQSRYSGVNTLSDLIILS